MTNESYKPKYRCIPHLMRKCISIYYESIDWPNSVLCALQLIHSIDIYIYTYTNKYTYIYTYTRLYIYIYIYIKSQCLLMGNCTLKCRLGYIGILKLTPFPNRFVGIKQFIIQLAKVQSLVQTLCNDYLQVKEKIFGVKTSV